MAKKHSRAVDVVAVLGEKTHRLVTVTGVVTLISPVNSWRNNVFLYNNGPSTVYIGKAYTDDAVPAPLSPANGIAIGAGGNFNDDSSYDAWYAVTDNVAGQLIVIETSVGAN